jgi:hypothetical protein
LSVTFTSALELAISSSLKIPAIFALASSVSISAFPLKLFTVTEPAAAASILKPLDELSTLTFLPKSSLFLSRLLLVQAYLLQCFL